MQPVQLSLMPEQVPAPPTQLLAELPDHHVAEAVRLLATLIAKTASPPQLSTVDGEEAGGE